MLPDKKYSHREISHLPSYAPRLDALQPFRESDDRCTSPYPQDAKPKRYVLIFRIVAIIVIIRIHVFVIVVVVRVSAEWPFQSLKISDHVSGRGG